MLKNKALLGVVIAITLVASAGIMIATQVLGAKQAAFLNSGFILTANEEAAAKKYLFPSNTKIKQKYPDQIEFNDIQGNSVTVPKDSFVHFDSDAISTFQDAVLVNLDEIGSEYINNYSIPEQMLLQRSSDGYTLETAKGPVFLNNFLLKVAEDKYILCSDKISLEFAPGDIREANGFVEVKYIDNSVVQLITSENVWHTISLSAKARLSNGTEFVFSENTLKSESGELPLSYVLVNSEDNIRVTASLATPEVKVPKFDIKTIDGENGEAGEGGESGQAGKPGEIGEDGIAGNPGDPGEAGQAGDAGEAGTQGSAGKAGVRGSSGSSGSSGADGLDGSTQGNSGGSTVNEDARSLPIFKITDWEVTATSVSGNIEVEDGRDLLVAGSGTMRIIEVSTGIEIPILDSSNNATVPFENSAVEFTYDKLKPDTQYRLLATSDYTIDNITYTRDFISRVFYTDSMGVFISKGVVELNAITVNLDKANYSLADSVDVYLLTEEENRTFDPLNSNNYRKATMDKTQSTYTKRFDGLEFNTDYIARMVSSRIPDGSPNPEYIVSSHELRVKTLRRPPTHGNPPTIGDPAIIQVISNGTFQLCLNGVTDPDNGIQNYRYEIYRVAGTEKTLVKTLNATTDEPVTLYVDGVVIERNKNYVMKVIAEFNDNEKIVEYATGFSDTFMMVSSSLPTVYFTPISMTPGDVVGGITFNSISGVLTVKKTSSSIDITKHPLKVIIEAPGYFYKTLDYTSAKLNVTPEGNIEIPISEDGLKEGEQLRMTVWGYVDMSDGRGYVERMIGSVVETIHDPKALQVQWFDAGKTFAIEKAVQLDEPTDSNGQPLYNAEYEASVLGQVVISLYEGTGTNKKFLKSVSEKNTNTTSNTESSLKALFYDKAYPVNEGTFNLTAQQLQASSYTLEVTSIYDYTYDITSPLRNAGNASGYTNTIPVVTGTQSTVVFKKSSPPPIASSGITMTPILNVQAAYYGATVDPALNGDTIIGFRVTSQYDNYATLARNITYYAFDEQTYDSPQAWAGFPDQIKAGIQVYNTPEIPINNRMSMPSVAFLMGGDAGYTRTLSDGTMVYNTGSYSNGKGMERGRRYYFAYTLKYNPDGGSDPTKDYPYDAEDYKSGDVLRTSSYGDAPKQAVAFSFYPWTSTANTYEWRYRFSDPDNALDPSQNFIWTNNNRINISTSFSGSTQNSWYNITFGSAENPLTPNYTLSVNTLQNLYVYPNSTTTLPLMRAPFGGLNTFNSAGITVTMDTTQVDQNVLNFNLAGPSTAIRRIAALRLTFSKGATTVTVHRALSDMDPSGTTARVSMPLSTIASLSGQTDITVRASFLYDDGTSGYNAITSGQYFALQVSTTTSLGAYKAKMSTGNTLGNFTDISGSVFNFNGTFPALNYNGITNLISGSLALSYSINGMTYSGGTALNEIIVPKQLSSAGDLLVTNTFTLTGIIPTLDVYEQTDITPYIDRINIRFQIEGQLNIDPDGTGTRYVYFDVYKGETGAGGNTTYPTRTGIYPIAVTTTTSSYNIVLNGLDANTKYLVIARAMVSEQEKTLIKNDSSTNAAAWYYTSTLSNLTIAVTGFNYFANNYSDKGYNLGFTLNQLTGYDIKYSLVRVETNNSETPVYSHDQLVNLGIITEHVAGVPYSTPYQKTFRFPPGTNLPYGFNYKLYITAYAKSDGSYKLGEASHTFTRFTPQPPSYYVSATPEKTDLGLNKLTFRVTIADPDKVIVGNVGSNWNGLYKVRFYDGPNRIYHPDDQNIYNINSSNLFILDNLADNKGYIIKLFAVYDMNNAGSINDISTVVSESELVSPVNDYLKYEKMEKTLDSNGIKLGTVTLSPQAADRNRIAVEFSGGVNLDRIALVEYSITNTTGNVMGGPIASPNIVKVNADFSYLDLPDTLPTAGTYFVTIRFKTADATVIDTLSFVYNRR